MKSVVLTGVVRLLSKGVLVSNPLSVLSQAGGDAGGPGPRGAL